MSIKQQRTAGRIRQLLSEIFLTSVSDPRLAGLTVTEVKIDRELRHANIYVAVIGATGQDDEALEGLESAKGYLRRELAQRLQLRSMPYLYFHWDARLEHVNAIETILYEMDIPDEDANPVDPDMMID